MRSVSACRKVVASWGLTGVATPVRADRRAPIRERRAVRSILGFLVGRETQTRVTGGARDWRARGCLLNFRSDHFSSLENVVPRVLRSTKCT